MNSKCFYFFIFILFSCSQAKQKQSKEVSLKESGVLRMKVDQQTANVIPFLQYFQNGNREYLFTLNPNRNELQIYDLKAERLSSKKAFEQEGELGVGAISAFLVHSLDSIYLFTDKRKAIYLTDTAASFIQKLDFPLSDIYNTPLVSSSFFGAPAVFYQGSLVFKTLFMGNYRNLTNAQLSTKHLSYAYNPNADSLSFLPHYFPNDYWQEKTKHYEFSMISNRESFVYSFFGDHKLYKAENLYSELKPFSAQSSFFKSEFDALPLAGSREDRLRYYATSQHYGTVLYDKYRDLYYRICYPFGEEPDSSKWPQLIANPRVFSIMVLDKDLNVRSEKLLTKDTYLSTNCFVGEKGLYVSMNHANSPENQEDYLKFRLFEVN